MTHLTPREKNYIVSTIPKDRSGEFGYSNGDRSSVVAKAKELRRKKEPLYGAERNVLFERLGKELHKINRRWKL